MHPFVCLAGIFLRSQLHSLVSLCCFGFNQLGFLFSHAAGQEGSISAVKMFPFSQKNKHVNYTRESVRLHSAALFTVGWTTAVESWFS